MQHDIERLFDAEPDAVVEASDVGRALQARVLPVFKHHYANFITDVPESKPGATPATYVLAAGYAGGKPFIVDSDPHRPNRPPRRDRLPSSRQWSSDGSAGLFFARELPYV